MSEIERYFHETWLGMVQPVDGLVVSIPVLVDAQCMQRQPPQVQAKLMELCPPTRKGEAGPEGYMIANLQALLSELLGFASDSFDVGDALPDALSLYVPEGRQTLRPTIGLKNLGEPAMAEAADTTPAGLAGAAYEMLVWELPPALDLDKAETVTGSWDYPPAAKFDRLLRHCRVPIGLLTNGEVVRLVYAPHGESSGAITFHLDDMASVGGRPILDAFVMLLSANRFFGVVDEETVKRTLPGILIESRKRQANVTNDLADQVFEALQILLRGFEAAAERDGRDLLDDAHLREGNHLYKGLLTVLLRLVFVLYAEDRGLLPVEHPFYAEHLSVLSLFEQLQADHGAYPDSMSRRFGAWGRLVTLFRAVFLGISQGDLIMPPRHGSLFNPHEYPFLEGWGPAGSAPITQPDDRAAVKLPTIDDETVFRVLEKLLVFEGQRLSYRALDVEQIGSVYEGLMGYHVMLLESSAVAIRLTHKPGAARAWLECGRLLNQPTPRRASWLERECGFDAASATKIASVVQSIERSNESAAVVALSELAARRAADRIRWRAAAGTLVLQPGLERRRTSSHYTPRSLSAPIVRLTLEPLLAVMGETPPSERILNLKVCDPAMGSGAFLVEACRFLADHVLAAWTREARVEALAAEHGDPLLHARRLVAQRCLYGVDKNDAAVELAKLSLWLVTLAKTLPFTFLDHSLRHGDSLIGLDFAQIRAFHWKRIEKETSPQLDLFGREIAVALDEAIALRQRIGELGDLPGDDLEKGRLFWDAQDALNRVRLIGDLLVGAFLAHEKEKDREAERLKRETLVRAWLLSGAAPSEKLLGMQRRIRAHLPVFHWMVEFPEIFYAGRPDPLQNDQINGAAFMDAFVGNPPFADGLSLSALYGNSFIAWTKQVLHLASAKADLSAHFFRRAAQFIGLHGTIGFVATKTIAQGDTREAALEPLLRDRFLIYSATRRMAWPGAADVEVAVLHLATGNVREGLSAALDGVPVTTIDSYLRDSAEKGAPRSLESNTGCAFQGAILQGMGFILSGDEARELIRRDARNADRVIMYMRGEEVNATAAPHPDKFVINFEALPLPAAEAWPDLLAIVRERVKPERDLLRDDQASARAAKQKWWQFWAPRVESFAEIRTRSRCLVSARDPQHFCFAFQPTDRVFNEKLNVFSMSTFCGFAILQSRVHSLWAARYGRTTGSAGTMSYSKSRCFDTFPFPRPDPRTLLFALEDIGQRLYNFRAQYMVDENVGLTVTYNRLKDPACTDPRVIELRKLHEEMDRKVIEAFAEGDSEGRWLDLHIPPYCPMCHEGNMKLQVFEDAVLDRLFVLNTKRADAEKVKGLGAPDAKRQKRVGTSPARGPKKSGGKKPAKEQLALVSSDPDAES